MNIYALTSLLAAVICFFLGNFIYYKNPENHLNKLVAILSILVAFLAFTEFAYRQAETITTAIFWLKLSTLWPFVPAILINISLVFTERKEFLKNKLSYFLIYTPAFIISIVGLGTNLLIIGATHEYWGWTYNLYPVSSFFTIMSIWSVFGGLFASILILNYYINSKEELEKKQTKYIFLGLFAPLVFSLITDLILPLSSIRIPELTMTSITVGLIFIAYGIWRYRFPVLTPAMAADKIISTMSNFLIILNIHKKILLVNQSALNLLKYSKEELIGKPSEFIFNKGKQEELFQDINLNEIGSIKTFETTIKTKNNVFIPALMSVSLIKISEKEPLGLVCIGSDLTKEKEIKKALEKSERLYSTLVKTDPDSIITTDLDGKIVYASQHSLQLYGFEDSRELIGKNIFDLIVPEYREKAKNDLKKTLNDDILRNLEYKLIKKNGVQFIGEWNTAVIRDLQEKPVAFMATARDITHHKNIEKQMQTSIQEKDVLLKEIHHRVKNNLQIISSLLNLQSMYIKDKEALDVFKESQNRVKSMAIVHEKLYQSGNFAEINFSEYLINLASSIYSSYGVDMDLIKLKIDADNIFLDINNAIPCGLMINELLTNAIKHAFPKGTMGEIKIDFHKKNKEYILTVQDNGVGLPRDLDLEKTESLGIQLINSLISQLDGKLDVTSNNGTRFKITFE